MIIAMVIASRDLLRVSIGLTKYFVVMGGPFGLAAAVLCTISPARCSSRSRSGDKDIQYAIYCKPVKTSIDEEGFQKTIVTAR